MREQTAGEELANTLTHGVGLLLSVAAMSVLLVFASRRRDAWIVVACSIYGATLVALYLASTLYHHVRSPRAKRIWNLLDHGAIYLLVAGTYTPFTLGPLRRAGGWGWSLFGAIWGLALAGIVFQALHLHRFRLLSVLSYVVMGWLAGIAIRPLWFRLTPAGVGWLALGGLLYTLGIVFYAWKSRRFAHAVWHVFVLAGSLAHFFAILFYVVLK
jgi:hemolysin III